MGAFASEPIGDAPAIILAFQGIAIVAADLHAALIDHHPIGARLRGALGFDRDARGREVVHRGLGAFGPRVAPGADRRAPDHPLIAERHHALLGKTADIGVVVAGVARLGGGRQ